MESDDFHPIPTRKGRLDWVYKMCLNYEYLDHVIDAIYTIVFTVVKERKQKDDN